MRRNTGKLVACVAGMCLAGVLGAVASQVDDQLTARQRVFKPIGPGLRAVKRGQGGKYYVLASPSVGVAVFDEKEKQLTVVGAPTAAGSDTARRAGIAFGEDCDVDAQGNVYVADRGQNLVSEWAPDGKLLRSIPVNGPVSVAALPEGEVAVSTLHGAHLVSVSLLGLVARRALGRFRGLFGCFVCRPLLSSLHPLDDLVEFLLHLAQTSLNRAK